MVNHVTLRDTRDEGGSRHLSATLKEDGTLVIEGQDIGPGVEGVLGSGLIEYEWVWTVHPSAVRTLKLALACDDGLLAALQDLFSGDAAAALQSFLDDNGIVYERWSRVGE
ncbi:hypothetical protein GC175_15175 [bacterium]|nr:hypothetical protein [bacterium]